MQPNLTDEEFSATLVDFMDSLRGFALFLTRSTDFAEDIAQEAAYKAWRARASFQRGTSFKSWIFTIARNQYYTEIRRKKLYGPMPAGELEVPPAQMDHMRVLEVEKRIASLNAEQRTVVLLVAAGASYDQAAAAIGCEVGTVKSRLSRGRQALLRE